MNNEQWIIVSDACVRHVWRDSQGNEHFIPPDFYEVSGTPIDEQTGNDMTYVRTEVFVGNKGY
jgi:hypothetical protein